MPLENSGTTGSGTTTSGAPRHGLQMAGIACGFWGLQQAWAVKSLQTTPLFRKTYGVALANVGFVWLAGPISGLIVQPAVGSFSDRSGRRAPFLLFGALGMSCCMMLLPCGREISSTGGLTVGVLSLWGLDLFMNSCLVSIRAVIADHGGSTEVQQGNINAWLMGAHGFGSLSGFSLGSFVGSEVAIFWISALVIVCAVCVAFIQIRSLELDKARVENESHSRVDDVTRYGGVLCFWHLPRWLQPLCCIVFFSWFSLFCLITIGSDWVGTVVFHGDPVAAHGSPEKGLYDHGVRFASVCFAAQAAVVISTGLLALRPLLSLVGMKALITLSVLLQSVLLILASLIPSRTVALLAIGGSGIPFALMESLPYIIVGLHNSAKETNSSGEILGKLNVYIVLGSLALTLAIHPVTKWASNDESVILLMGGIGSLGALLAVPFIKLPPLPADYCLVEDDDEEIVNRGTAADGEHEYKPT
jgi:maltose/moltooligosaccharide transporter